MNEVKLNSSVYRWFRYETCCFLTRDIQPCLGNESIYCVSCKVCYTIVLVCTCIWTNLCQMLYKNATVVSTVDGDRDHVKSGF